MRPATMPNDDLVLPLLPNTPLSTMMTFAPASLAARAAGTPPPEPITSTSVSKTEYSGNFQRLELAQEIHKDFHSEISIVRVA